MKGNISWEVFVIIHRREDGGLNKGNNSEVGEKRMQWRTFRWQNPWDLIIWMWTGWRHGSGWSTYIYLACLPGSLWNLHFQALSIAKSRSQDYELPSPIQHFGIYCGTFSSCEWFSVLPLSSLYPSTCISLLSIPSSTLSKGVWWLQAS